MKVLVTGGAGYIGSHTCLALLELGYDVVAVDNFCNSSPESLKRVDELTGKQVPLYGIDVRDEAALALAAPSTSRASRPWGRAWKSPWPTMKTTCCPP